MEGPRKIRPKGPNDYLEIMTKAVFQSGISWRVIEAKWDGFREAFFGFDAERIAALAPPDIDRLAQDTRIVRNRKKIEATVHNAETMLELDKEYGSFKRYLRSHGGFDETVSDLRRRFKFVGDTGAYYFLHVVGEPVPPHEEWMKAHGGGSRGGSTRERKRAGSANPPGSSANRRKASL
jgi:3-methyladenine DNA glycosylase Tag